MGYYINYRGYTAKVFYSIEDQIFVGQVVGIRDVIRFHADDPFDITRSFHSAVDDYIDYCRERGIKPGGDHGE